MATYRITITKPGLQERTVAKLRKLLEKELGKRGTVSVAQIKNPESRAERFAEAQSQVSDAKNEIESLIDELEQWRNNLPENLQQGEKADTIGTAVDELETCREQLAEVESASVDFPSMF